MSFLYNWLPWSGEEEKVDELSDYEKRLLKDFQKDDILEEALQNLVSNLEKRKFDFTPPEIDINPSCDFKHFNKKCHLRLTMIDGGYLTKNATYYIDFYNYCDYSGQGINIYLYYPEFYELLGEEILSGNSIKDRYIKYPVTKYYSGWYKSDKKFRLPLSEEVMDSCILYKNIKDKKDENGNPIFYFIFPAPSETKIKRILEGHPVEIAELYSADDTGPVHAVDNFMYSRRK